MEYCDGLSEGSTGSPGLLNPETRSEQLIILIQFAEWSVGVEYSTHPPPMALLAEWLHLSAVLLLLQPVLLCLTKMQYFLWVTELKAREMQ